MVKLYESMASSFNKYLNEEVEEKENINECNDSFVESINKVLSRMNEAEMSDEDKRDSELLRRVIGKIGKRVDAKFTPEEQEVLDKYGLDKRSNRYEPEVYSSSTGVSISNSDAHHYNANLADMARKQPERRKNRPYSDYQLKQQMQIPYLQMKQALQNDDNDTIDSLLKRGSKNESLQPNEDLDEYCDRLLDTLSEAIGYDRLCTEIIDYVSVQTLVEVLEHIAEIYKVDVDSYIMNESTNKLSVNEYRKKVLKNNGYRKFAELVDTDPNNEELLKLYRKLNIDDSNLKSSNESLNESAWDELKSFLR